MTAVLKFDVLEGNVVLAGQTFAAGSHEIDNPDEELVRHAGSAHNAGGVVVTEGLVDDHVQSQADAEKALADAMGSWHEPELQPDGTKAPGFWDGPWWDGHLAQASLDAELKQNALAAAGIAVDAQPEGGEDE